MTVATAPQTRRPAYTGPYAALINKTAGRTGIDAWLLAALLYVESAFNPNARSKTGDVGIAQINLASHPHITQAEALNPNFAIPWAARYLVDLKQMTGSTRAALRAYNTGSGAASPAGNRYAAKVLAARSTSLKAAHRGAGPSALSVAGWAGIDQGVDFTKKGQIPALAAATVTDIGSVPIIEGGSYPYVVYRLDAGPHKGKFVYVMESFKPSVKVGQRLAAGQSIGYATGNGVGIEIGFNRTAQGQNAVAKLYPNPHSPKAAGYQMEAYLEKLGLKKHAIPTRVGGTASGLGTGGGGGGGLWNDIKKSGLVGLPAANFPGATGLGGAALGGAQGIAKKAMGLGEFLGKAFTDPGYVVLWLGFAIVGLAFIFLGVERLLGRSASHDVSQATATAATAAKAGA